MKKIAALLVMVLPLLCGCGPDGLEGDRSRPIDDGKVGIEYLGKDWGAEATLYGDWFSISAPEDFAYRYAVAAAGSPVPSGSSDGEILSGTGSGTVWGGVIPSGKYVFYVIETDADGNPSDRYYAKDFTVTEDISFGIDGEPSYQSNWRPVYVGSYADVDDASSGWLDRLSAEGTGDVLYYHVVAKHNSIFSNEELLDAFEKGAGLDDLQGGAGLIAKFRSITGLLGNWNSGLDLMLACGGAGDELGYIDYKLKEPGYHDVYVVEMRLNGHITGRYGKASLPINGAKSPVR